MVVENTEKAKPDIIIAGVPYYTRTALAKAMGKSVQTLAGWRTRGFGPSLILIGRKVLYPQQEVINWLNSQIVNPANTDR